MKAFEVGHLGRVASFNQCFKARLDQFDRAAAQHSLLTEQVSLGLLTEIGLDHTGLATTVRGCV